MTVENLAPGIADGMRRHPELAATTGLAVAAGVGLEGIGPLLAHASVVVHPLDPQIAEGVTVQVAPAADKATYLNMIGAEIRLPHVESGLRITPFAINNSLTDKRTLETFASLVAKPKGAEQAIRQQYDSRELQYDIGAALSLPFLCAAVFKYLRHRLVDPRASFLRRHPVRAAVTLAAALAGASYGVESAYETYDSVTASKYGECRPARLPGRTLETQDIEVCGKNAKPILHWARQIVGTINEGQDYWDKSATAFVGAWRKFEASGRYKDLLGPDRVVGLAISGSHCDYGYMESLLPAIVSAAKPDFALVGGDLYIHNGDTPLEDGCHDELLSKLPVTRSVQGNHDPQEPQKGDIGPDDHYTSKLPAINFDVIGAPDPRSYDRNQHGKLDGDALKQAFEAEDTLLTRKACEVLVQTGFRPIVEIHDGHAADEVIESGCASVVNTGHGAINYWQPQFVPITSATGETTYHATTVTAAGYAGGYYDIISPAKRPGSAMLEIFDRYTHELVGNVVIAYGPALGEVSIRVHKLPAQDIYDYRRNLQPGDFQRPY